MTKAQAEQTPLASALLFALRAYPHVLLMRLKP